MPQTTSSLRARSILCPVDFSDGSRGALRYAAAIAESLGSALVVLSINDPLLQEAAGLLPGGDHLLDDTRRELERFVRKTLDTHPQAVRDLQCDVAIGAPATEILRFASDRSCGLIVMSSHGLTGLRKMFFGSTTERVLREATVPVLVTAAGDPGSLDAEAIRKSVRRILMPADPTSDADLVLIVRDIAAALSASVLLLHVVEPLRAIVGAQRLPGIEQERRTRAEGWLETLAATISWPSAPERLVAYGEPAEEIAKIANARAVGLIVMGLHASPRLGRHIGSVTYRVLCLARGLVLAVPPRNVAREDSNSHTTNTEQTRPKLEVGS
jgi:nucleotide-binding universal stress UspA family protein